jgi:D-hexose-6-phosphate mutarotase
MDHDQLQALNEQFGVANKLHFMTGAGNLVFAHISNDYATATVAIQGGHVLSYQPHGGQPVLWVSELSNYSPGKAIRGGIPICWPWFGPHPTGSSLPAHGFARTAAWSVVSSETGRDGATQLRLELVDNEQTRAVWPHAFRLTIEISVGRALQVDLISHNSGNEPFTYGGALHSYFHVSDISNISISGLDGTTFIDQLQGNERHVQRGQITFSGEVDCIYQGTDATCTINDSGLQRRVLIAKNGSNSTVVWNPWIAKAQRMTDFGDDEYRGMVCVETSNAADDVVTVAPGDNHLLRAIISVEANTE